MAGLTGSTIADSYDQLVISNNASGGNTSNLITLQDGDGATTYCVSMNDASTAKSILSIDGSHANGTALQIDNSATDGDVSVEWQLTGTTTWLMGIEDGDSDSLKICNGSTMGNDVRLTFETAATVVNNGSGDIDFRIESDDNVNMFFVDASEDKIGIGTTSPISALEIEDGLTTVGAVLTLGTKEPTVVADDILGRINFYAPLETGTDAIAVAASILAIAEDTFSASVNSTSLQFQTGASEVATTKMTIREDGNVGIGVAAPESVQTYTRCLEIGNDADNTSTSTALVLSSWTSGGAEDVWEIAAQDAGLLQFVHSREQGDGATGIMMCFDIVGKVGIGLTAPTAQLHIDQSSASKAVPVLKLDQADVDDSFIDFIGATASDQTKSLSTDTSVGALTGHIKIEINGSPFWLAYYAPN